MIGKVSKKSKVYWIKKIGSKVLSRPKEEAKKAAGILGRDFFPSSGSTNIVMDDEIYFGLKNDITAGNICWNI